MVPMSRTANLSILTRDSTTVEIDLFTSVLSLEFYELVKSKATDWSTVHPFQEGKTYTLDDLVEHEFVVYKSLANSNTAMLIDSTKWAEAKPFEEAIFNSLWESGMASWLANSIWASVFTFQVYQMGGKGLVKHFDDSGERTTNEREFYTAKREVEASIARGKRVMMAFISANKTALGYSDTDQNNVVDEENCRIGFLY